MRRELLIAAGPGEWRAALIEDAAPVELRVERGAGDEFGSIHLGRVVRLLPALGAALVEIGGDRPGFLPQSQILPRGRRLTEGERVVVQIRREAQGGKAAQLSTAVSLGKDIAAAAVRLEPPARLYPAPGCAAALAAVLPATDQILVDEPGVIPDIRAAFPDALVTPLSQDQWPFDIGALYDEALAPSLQLRGGGSLHFFATPAAMMIDVDSGTPQTGSPEQTALAINLAAAEAIARHIRLRNLAGGVVIDFVGSDDRKARDRVRTAMVRHLAADPMRPEILGWTRLGHLEVLRRRRTRPLADALLEPAPPGGIAKTARTLAHEALAALWRAARAQPGCRWRLGVAPDVAAALTGRAAGALREVEQRLGRPVSLAAEASLDRSRFQIAAL